jgi:hypothetical protein
MPAILKNEIEPRTAACHAAERENRGCFWGGGGVKLSRAEAEVFAKEIGGLTSRQAEAMYWKGLVLDRA